MVHTRATNTDLFDFDAEIERTFHNNLRASREAIINMGEIPRTLRELTAPDLAQQPLAVLCASLSKWSQFRA